MSKLETPKENIILELPKELDVLARRAATEGFLLKLATQRGSDYDTIQSISEKKEQWMQEAEEHLGNTPDLELQQAFHEQVNVLLSSFIQTEQIKS